MRGVAYQAVIRVNDRDSSDVTWAEFVEAGYLREYRIKGTVSLQRLRKFIDLARESWGVPYPLAHFKPLVGERRDLLIRLKELQDEAQLDDDLQLVRLVDPETGQLAFSAAFMEFLSKVQFSDGVATSMHPLGASVPVVIHPDVAFGCGEVFRGGPYGHPLSRPRRLSGDRSRHARPGVAQRGRAPSLGSNPPRQEDSKPLA